MTWINSDLNKIAKQIEMDVIKFDYDTPYNVSSPAGGTTAYQKAYSPLLFGNKQIITGVDFLPVYNYTAVTPNIPYFKIADFDTGTYIYIFEICIGYLGYSANEAVQRHCFLSSNGILDRIWNVSGLPTTMPAYQYQSTVNSSDPVIGFDYYSQQGIKDYTLDLSNPEKTKCIFFLGGSSTGGALVTPIGANFSFVSRIALTSNTATYPVHTINSVSMTVKRIKKV